jgi:hypothetical protein
VRRRIKPCAVREDNQCCEDNNIREGKDIEAQWVTRV